MIQATPRKSATRQASVARRLINRTSIPQHILDVTVEIENCQQDIIYRPGRRGDLFLVRSSVPAQAERYYPVTCIEPFGYSCCCGRGRACPHVDRVQVWIKDQYLAEELAAC